MQELLISMVPFKYNWQPLCCDSPISVSLAPHGVNLFHDVLCFPSEKMTNEWTQSKRHNVAFEGKFGVFGGNLYYPAQRFIM